MTMRSMVLLILFAVVTAAPVQFAEEWNAWKSLHGRSYSSGAVGVKGREGGRDGKSKGEGGMEGDRGEGRERARQEEGSSREVTVLTIIVHRRSCTVTLYGWPTDSTLTITTLSTLRRLDLLLP